MVLNDKAQNLIKDITEVFHGSKIQHYHVSHYDCIECGRKHTTPNRNLCQLCLDYFHSKKYGI